MQVGILGGTFNPIHNTHIAMALAAKEALGLRNVQFMPSGVSYLKDQREIVSKEHRFKMVQQAIKEYPGQLAVSRIELDQEGNSYTFETLRRFKEIHPWDEITFIMGADNLYTMENWYHPELIFQEARIAATVRGDKDMGDLEKKVADLKSRFQADIVLFPFEKSPLSSTEIRAKLKAGEDVSAYIPAAVYDYIKLHHLYRAEN